MVQRGWVLISMDNKLLKHYIFWIKGCYKAIQTWALNLIIYIFTQRSVILVKYVFTGVKEACVCARPLVEDTFKIMVDFRSEVSVLLFYNERRCCGCLCCSACALVCAWNTRSDSAHLRIYPVYYSVTNKLPILVYPLVDCFWEEMHRVLLMVPC